MTTKQWAGIILVSGITSFGSGWGISKYKESTQPASTPVSQVSNAAKTSLAGYNPGDNTVPFVDFEMAAKDRTETRELDFQGEKQLVHVANSTIFQFDTAECWLLI